MKPFWKSPYDGDTLRPSLAFNSTLALGCLVFAAILFRTDPAEAKAAFLWAIFLVFSAAVILATHLPGCTGVWLDDDGFTVRDMYKSTRYRWSEVGSFVMRRRLLGTEVEFPYSPPDGGPTQARHLPRALNRPGWKIALMMNRRRERALAPGG